MNTKVVLCLFILSFQIFMLDKVFAAESLPFELRKSIVAHTASFEGENGFSTVTGNWDGLGISFGALRFNIRNKTLQKLLQEHIKSDPNGFENIFGQEKARILKDILIKPYDTQMEWARSITDPTDSHRLKSEWHQAFTKLGESPKNQQIQIEQSKHYLDVAIKYSKDINIKTTQGLAYFFDLVVHFGYLNDWNEIKTRVNNSGNIDEKQKLAIVQQFVKKRRSYVR